MQFPLKRQKMRFKSERKELQEIFGSFVSIRNVLGETIVEVKAKTTKDNEYALRCYMRCDYPNSMPFLVVCYPNEPLKDGNGEPMKLSYENHCLGFDNEHGLTAICHCRPDRWDRQNMHLCDVFMKGLIWLEAYELMKETGKSMSCFLKEMPMSEEVLEKLRKEAKRAMIEWAEFLEGLVDRLMFEFGCQNVEELLSRLSLNEVEVEDVQE